MDTIAERRAALVSALRSGKYKQGRSFLRLADDYCCLGVACDVAGESWIAVAGDEVFAVSTHQMIYLNSTTYMTESVREYYGFVSERGACRQWTPCVAC